MSQLKALVVQAPFESDLGNIMQIARAEAMKIFRKPNKIKILDKKIKSLKEPAVT